MKKSTIFFLYLLIVSCLGQLSADIYLPALPKISQDFNTTAHYAQLSLSLFMFGYAISHLLYGPISDGIGRKSPLIFGTVICIIGTIICQFSHHIDLFIAGRFIQGFGAGASTTLFRSILRDIYSGDKLAKMGSILAITRVIILASAPLIGAYISHLFGWRFCFVFIVFYALACLVSSIILFKETNQHKSIDHIKLIPMAKNCLMLLSNSVFIGNSLIVMLTFGGILAWLTALPFLLQEVVGLNVVQFGWISAIAGLFFIIGGFINAMLVEKTGLYFMLKAGLFMMIVSGMLMLALGLTIKINTFVIMVPVIIYITGSSMIFANAYAGAFQPFPKIAGTAGAIFGFLQVLGGALSSMLMSYMRSLNQIPLSLTLLLSSILALAVALFMTKENQLKVNINPKRKVSL